MSFIYLIITVFNRHTHSTFAQHAKCNNVLIIIYLATKRAPISVFNGYLRLTEMYTVSHKFLGLKNAVISPHLAATWCLLLASLSLFCLSVTVWWHTVQRVRRLSTWHSPPPSATGFIWSTCQNWNTQTAWFNRGL